MESTMLIDIGSGTWEVFTVPPRDDKLMHGQHEALGMCYYQDKQIYLANTDNLDTWFQTLFHEIVHAIAFEYGIGSLMEEAGHEDVDRLGLAVYDILKRNQYIQQEEEEINETIN